MRALENGCFLVFYLNSEYANCDGSETPEVRCKQIKFLLCIDEEQILFSLMSSYLTSTVPFIPHERVIGGIGTRMERETAQP